MRNAMSWTFKEEKDHCGVEIFLKTENDCWFSFNTENIFLSEKTEEKYKVFFPIKQYHI